MCASTSSVTWSRADPWAPVVAPDPDMVLVHLGEELAARVSAAVPGWVLRCVDALMPPADPGTRPGHGQGATRPVPRGPAPGRPVKLGGCWRRPTSTPNGRPRWRWCAWLWHYPTAVLEEAGVPPVSRDPFVSQRFPDDPYGLTPASLAAVDPELGEVAIAGARPRPWPTAGATRSPRSSRNDHHSFVFCSRIVHLPSVPSGLMTALTSPNRLNGTGSVPGALPRQLAKVPAGVRSPQKKRSPGWVAGGSIPKMTGLGQVTLNQIIGGHFR